MKVSACCLTYGRNSLLAEAVESFLRQDCEDSELVVFNTLVSQNLWIDHPRVRVINHPSRPATLGETRNLAIQECRGEFVVTWDDDDIYLPHYLSWLVNHVGDGDWIRQAARFDLTQWKITQVSCQACNQLMFRKSAWERLGGYPAVDSGEDRVFVGKLQASLPGRSLELPRKEIGFMYGWANGAFHVSGCGENQPGKATALTRARRHVQMTPHRRGNVQIVPRWEKDYVTMANDWLAQHP